MIRNGSSDITAYTWIRQNNTYYFLYLLCFRITPIHDYVLVTCSISVLIIITYVMLIFISVICVFMFRIFVIICVIFFCLYSYNHNFHCRYLFHICCVNIMSCSNINLIDCTCLKNLVNQPRLCPPCLGNNHHIQSDHLVYNR